MNQKSSTAHGKGPIENEANTFKITIDKSITNQIFSEQIQKLIYNFKKIIKERLINYGNKANSC